MTEEVGLDRALEAVSRQRGLDRKNGSVRNKPIGPNERASKTKVMRERELAPLPVELDATSREVLGATLDRAKAA